MADERGIGPVLQITPEQRPELYPRFRRPADGTSESAFAGIYLFRERHEHGISRLEAELFVISGLDAQPFFMLSFRLPTQETLDRPFVSYGTMKAVLRKEQKGIYRYVGQTVPTTCPTGTNS